MYAIHNFPRLAFIWGKEKYFKAVYSSSENLLNREPVGNHSVWWWKRKAPSGFRGNT
jgi:hypothetical protein